MSDSQQSGIGTQSIFLLNRDSVTPAAAYKPPVSRLTAGIGCCNQWNDKSTNCWIPWDDYRANIVHSKYSYSYSWVQVSFFIHTGFRWRINGITWSDVRSQDSNMPVYGWWEITWLSMVTLHQASSKCGVVKILSEQRYRQLKFCLLEECHYYYRARSIVGGFV